MTSIKQAIGINDNMIQQSPSLTLMAIPTLMSTPITNYWCQHVDTACSTSIFNVTISPHQSLPSIDINHINVIISPPLTSMEKGHSPLGVAPLAWTLLGATPPIWMPLIFLWIISPLFNKGYHSDVMLNILPLWPLLPLKLCFCALYSNIGLFSRYVFDKYLLLESWEEEWLPIRVCLPLSSLQDEQYATIWRSLDLFMHQTCAIPFIMK